MKTVSLKITDTNTATVTFNRPHSAANIFDLATLDELESIITKIEALSEITRVIFISEKKKVFIAGADIKSFKQATPEEMKSFLKKGQDLFSRIAKLKAITAAAIHGACLGGGLELALACDLRVASTAPCTKIGLPETQLGIIPAWGGSTRIPLLIGVSKSLRLILKGKTLSATHAKKMGVIDETAPPERLEKRCLQMMSALPKRKYLAFKNSLPICIIARLEAYRTTYAKTRGQYPALMKAIQVVTRCPHRSLQASLKAERKAVIDLFDKPVTQQLLRLFFLNESNKKTSVQTYYPVPTIKTSAVIGAGVMGAGIAQWSASRGVPVYLKDLNSHAVAHGLNTVKKRFKEGVQR
ncbi:MAG: enoyl-CoA hydratase-related protein, partial [Verrucomicrobiota bacterium]